MITHTAWHTKQPLRKLGFLIFDPYTLIRLPDIDTLEGLNKCCCTFYCTL